MTTRYLFIIDTSDYAGNFERDMCAYLTGRVGDCNVGDDMASLYTRQETEMFDNVICWPDDHGCHRPCVIWPEPKSGDMNSVAIIFAPDEPPTKEQVEIMKRRAKIFPKTYDKWGHRPERILGFRLLREETEYVEEDV